MILRIRSKDGMQRVFIDDISNTNIIEICQEQDLRKIEVSKSPYGERYLASFLSDKRIDDVGFVHGDIIYVHVRNKDEVSAFSEQKAAHASSSGVFCAPKKIVQEPVDDFLDMQDGKILNTQNALCKHGPKGMCEYCMPLDPYDSAYLKQNKIKHYSFHSYLKKVSKNSASLGNTPFLVEPFYGIKKNCQTGHKQWPLGICTKCQPPAVTLQTQEFRMVDHVEFSDPYLIETFLDYWRLSGHQRFGYLYGRYEPYDAVPLGIKAVVEVIYEPPQENEQNGLSLLPWDSENNVDEVACLFGIKKVGMIFTDLTDDGSGKRTVVCKRHVNSFFLSSLEVVFAAEMQLKHKNVSKWSETGEFGSKFVTCVVSANKEGGIDIFAYQVSNTAMALVDAKIIEPSVDPNTMLICKEDNDVYIPEVFFQKINQYKMQVQESAKSSFPTEYLLVTLTHGFPMKSESIFSSSNTFVIENRASIGQVQNISTLAERIKPILLQPHEDTMKTLCDFHFLTYLWTLGILGKEDKALLIKCVKEWKINDLYSLLETSGWQTLIAILREFCGGLIDRNQVMTNNKQDEQNEHNTGDDDEDYMTMELPDVSSSLLSERQRKIHAKKEKGICKPYREREWERREEGLRSSLMDTEKPSKAMSMMFKMGYVKGSSLGQGHSQSNLEPLKINMKTDRAGIGHETMKKEKIIQETLKIQEDEVDYKTRVRLENETKYFEAKIREAQKICENLNEKNSDEPYKVNVLWRGLVVERIKKEKERIRKHAILDRVQDVYDLQNDEVKPAFHTQVEWSQEDDEDLELDAFNQLEPKVRLEKILNYLRENYYYCFWCGCAYENSEDLLEKCPGEREDH
ncbi:hypothetical protein PORY_002606 [Pneumocystis oryctolagi]|uniref:Uncharacterized protein n=1 Tax=Pneumocystis oryctolagi TaxID=42067 RepID=A0ACB7CAL2_9ASCO|nr:hypothetical protein PORY_002606 [Pneumocystis oryctolagi]